MVKILIADDDINIIRLLRLTLPESYEILQATDGDETFEKAEMHVPSLILLDINMPRLNGFEVLRKVRQSPKLKKTRVIVITARSDEADRNLAMQLEADAYFAKPFSPLSLLQTVSQLLGEGETMSETIEQGNDG
jgi:CheY-like chemotaxis protein